MVQIMKATQEQKASLVDFIRSIKFSHHHSAPATEASNTHFARFKQRVRTKRQYSSEDSQLVRSAN